MDKYILYDSTEDSVVCKENWEVMLFDDYESAESEWIGYPEQVTHFNQLPIHIQEIILNEKNQTK